jgi:hypothetical protein
MVFSRSRNVPIGPAVTSSLCGPSWAHMGPRFTLAGGPARSRCHVKRTHLRCVKVGLGLQKWAGC